MKTIVTGLSLTDAIMVCKAIPDDEIEQIELLSGMQYNPEDLAVRIFQSTGLKWTCRIAETNEPLAVGGYEKVGVATWRSFMLANERAWAEYGREVTQHVIDVIKKLCTGEQNIRLETICLATRERARRWYETIGLEYESTLRGYGVHGEDAVMYVKVYEGAKDE